MSDISKQMDTETQMDIPPEGSPYIGCRDAYFAILEDEVSQAIDKHHIIICVDFNSRTVIIADYDTFDSDVQHVITARLNQDNITNKYGRSLITFFKRTQLKTENGRFFKMFKDKNIGTFTYYSQRGTSIIDYLILQDNSVDNLKHFEKLAKLV